MAPFARSALVVGLVLLPLLLAGVFKRRLYRACLVFPMYVVAVWLGELVVLLWPERFYVWSFWQFKETLYAVLKLGIALEITALAYQAFPGAAAVVRRAILAVLVVGFGIILSGIPSGADMQTLARDLQPRLAQATVLVFATTWGLILWYHLPMHRFHKAILRGFVPYLLVFTVARGLLVSLGWEIWKGVNVVDTVAYTLLILYWTWEAWRPAPPEDPFLRTLQPWRGRL